jgi:indole-3-glycerol phosphate synthase
MDILKQICAAKRLEVAQQKKDTPVPALERTGDPTRREAVSFKQALIDSPTGIIAEFKRRSPSRDWLHPEADAATVAAAYEQAGAAALSVLTDTPFFGGSFQDLRQARQAVRRIPVLRKDFIIDDYQVHQSKALGADAILLIAACLTPRKAARLAATARALGMEVLLEIHNERELDYITGHVDVVGVNNRDLARFVTDIDISLQLADRIPAGVVKISESGLSHPQTVKTLREAGYQGFLMGEHFMKTPDPGKALAQFLQLITN